MGVFLWGQHIWLLFLPVMKNVEFDLQKLNIFNYVILKKLTKFIVCFKS